MGTFKFVLVIRTVKYNFYIIESNFAESCKTFKNVSAT